MSHPLLPKNLNKDNALFRQGKPDYSKLAVDAFPVPTVAEQGAILEVTDVGDRYIWTGTVWLKTHSRGVPLALDTAIEVAALRVPGVGSIEKFGENPDVDASAAFETLWDAGGIYVPPTQARIHDIASDNAADIGVLVSSGSATAGSGALTLEDTGATFIADGVVPLDLILNDTGKSFSYVDTVDSETQITLVTPLRDPDRLTIVTPFAAADAYRVVTDGGLGASALYIKGQDEDRFEIDEFIILNGITNVPTLLEYDRQSRAIALANQLSPGAVGIITSTAQTDGTVSCQIINGNNQTLMAIDSIPADKNGYITQWWGSLSKKGSAGVTVNLRVGIIDGIGLIKQTRSISGTGSSEFDYTFPTPVPLGPGVDIWVEASSDTNNIGVSGGFSITLEDI